MPMPSQDNPEFVAKEAQLRARLAPRANPTHFEQLKFEQVEELRYLDCPHYEPCLAYTALLNWSNFVCISCELNVRDTNT